MNEYEHPVGVVRMARMMLEDETQQLLTLKRPKFQVLVDLAESALPKTRTIKVWRVEYVDREGKPQINTISGDHPFWDMRAVANDEAHRLSVLGCNCIKVTGPHDQEVMA